MTGDVGSLDSLLEVGCTAGVLLLGIMFCASLPANDAVL